MNGNSEICVLNAKALVIDEIWHQVIIVLGADQCDQIRAIFTIV